MVHQINSLKQVLKLKRNFLKNKVVRGKTPFFVIGPFCTHHSNSLNIGFWYGSFVWKWCVFRLKRFSSFLKKVFVFQKICLKVESIEIVQNFRWLSHKNTQITYVLSVGFKMEPASRSFFSVLRQKPNQILP